MDWLLMLLNVSPDAPLYEPLGSAPSQFVCGFFATISERGLAVFLQDGIVANRIGQCNKTTPVGLIQQSYNGSAGTPLPCEQDIDRPIVILINDLGGKLAVQRQSDASFRRWAPSGWLAGLSMRRGHTASAARTANHLVVYAAVDVV